MSEWVDMWCIMKDKFHALLRVFLALTAHGNATSPPPALAPLTSRQSVGSLNSVNKKVFPAKTFPRQHSVHQTFSNQMQLFAASFLGMCCGWASLKAATRRTSVLPPLDHRFAKCKYFGYIRSLFNSCGVHLRGIPGMISPWHRCSTRSNLTDGPKLLNGRNSACLNVKSEGS